MKKTAKGIIALAAVLAVMGGGYAALKLTEPEDGGDTSASTSSESTPEAETAVLVSDDIPDTEDTSSLGYNVSVIKTVTVKNKDGELHVVQKTAPTEDSAATYTLDGYQDVLMKDSIIGTLANNANGLTSEALIAENCSDLAKYGLASPSATVDIEYESGKKIQLLLGNEAPDGGVTYAMIGGTDTVYTVRDSAVANYSKTIMELVETTVLKAPDELPVVKSLRIEREDMDTDILLKYDDSESNSQYSGGTSAAHYMEEPTFAYLAVERATDITTGMFGLSAKEVYSVHCEDADIAEAGLKEPFCKVTMDCDDGNTYVLLLSEPFIDGDNEKCCYAMIEGGNVIYTVSTENAKWAVIQPVDIASKIFIASYVWNLTDLSVTTNTGGKSEFVLTKKNPNETKDSYTADDFDTKLNGKAFDTERFRKFYSFIISANAEDFALGEEIPSGEPMASLEYTDSYNGAATKIDFYSVSNLNALVVINGESKFFISKSFVETLISNTRILESEDEFVTTWR